MTRDLNQEYQDTEDRKYAYDFDYVHRDYMLKQMSPFFTGRKALELGCYHGEFTKRLQKYFDDITVVEGASDLLEIARSNVGDDVRFIQSLFEDVELEEKYDAVFLVHTLEHLDDPVNILKRIKGWLSDTGKLFLVTPNANAASRQIAAKMGLIEYNSAVTEGERIHGHRKTYSLDTLEDEARQAEFNVIHRGGIFFKPFANFQFDQLMQAGIIDQGYLDGCYELGMLYPDLCASIYLICTNSEPGFG